MIHVSGKLVPYRNFSNQGYYSRVIVATGQPLPPPTICELKIDTKVFVSRISMDFSIVFCEGRYDRGPFFEDFSIVFLCRGTAVPNGFVSQSVRVLVCPGLSVRQSYIFINFSEAFLACELVFRRVYLGCLSVLVSFRPKQL